MRKRLLINTLVLFISIISMSALCGQTQYVSSGEAVISLFNEVKSVENNDWESDILSKKAYISFLGDLKQEISSGNDIEKSMEKSIKNTLSITDASDETVVSFLREKTAFLFIEE